MNQTRTAKQNAILDGALELISERGFHDAPISEIARRAGVGAGTIYRYYETKDELIRDLYIREKRNLVAKMLSGCSEDLSVKENFRRLWGNMLSLGSGIDSCHRFLDQFYNSPFVQTVTAEERRELAAGLFSIVERGIAEGVLRDLPFAVIGSLVLGAVSQLSMHVKSGDLELTDEVSELAFDACWRGIAAS